MSLNNNQPCFIDIKQVMHLANPMFPIDWRLHITNRNSYDWEKAYEKIRWLF